MYIIKEGVFEATRIKHTTKESNADNLYRQMLGPQGHSSLKPYKINPKYGRTTVRLSQYAKGQLIGEEDAIVSRNYSSTVKCISSTGVVLRVKTSDFVLKFGKFDATWNAINERVRDKEEEFV